MACHGIPTCGMPREAKGSFGGSGGCRRDENVCICLPLGEKYEIVTLLTPSVGRKRQLAMSVRLLSKFWDIYTVDGSVPLSLYSRTRRRCGLYEFASLER